MAARENPWSFVAAPLALVTVLSAVYLFMEPLSADHAAQTFRTELFELSGPTVWNNYWFGGHYLPSYSLLAPPIGAWIGFRIMGVVAVLGTVVLFALTVRKEWGEQAQAGAIWFAAAATVSLFSGRMTFALGVFLAVAAIHCAQRGWRLPSLVVAGAVGLASPVAALFLACCGFAHWLSRRPDRRGLEIALVTFVVAGAVALLFPGGGDEPYVWTSFYPAFTLTLIAAVLVPKEEKLVRTGMVVYAFALVAAFALNTPMGGNANRLGVLLIGPLLLCVAWPRRTLAILAFVPLFMAWQFFPVLRDLELVDDEPAVAAEFYEPVDEALGPRLAVSPARVEVVPVASHWESARVAPGFPLARGWERQTDRNYNPLFYEDELDPERYHRWLKRLAVGYVAVPQAELDYAGKTEAELIETNPSFLEEIPADGDWRIYRVRGATPMVQRPAYMTGLTTDGFTVTSPRAGSYTVRIRSTPYWNVKAGRGCVDSTGHGWTRVFLARPGKLAVVADFSPGGRFGDRNCRP